MDLVDSPNALGSSRSIDSQQTERSLGQLIRNLSDDSLLLVKKEAELFRAETEQKIVRAERRAAVLGAGGALAWNGVMALTAALILLLSQAIEPWSAALIVGIVFVAMGAAAIVYGKKKLDEESLAPTKTLNSVKRDVHVVTEALR